MAFYVAVENWVYIYVSNVIEVFHGVIVTVKCERWVDVYLCFKYDASFDAIGQFLQQYLFIFYL
jgi:hypothetical protein